MRTEKIQKNTGPPENSGRTKSKWYRKKWLRVTAVCLVTVLVVSEFVIHYTAQQEIQTDFGPETLLDAQIQEVLKDPMKVLEAFKDAKRQLQDKQQKLLDACNKAEKLIKEEKYEEAIEPVDYLLKEMELTEEEKIQMKMTRTALCFSAGRFDEAMEGCTELINLDRSEEGYYYFMRSVCSIQKEDYSQAKDDLLEALAHGYKDEALCYVHLAFCENYLEDYKEVLKYAELAEEKGAEDVYHTTLTYLMAVASLKEEKFQDSISYITELLVTDQYKKSGDLYFYRGVSELTLEEYQKAYDDFQKAMKYGLTNAQETGGEQKKESNTMLYYNRGIAALGLNRLEDAAEDLRKVVENNDYPELTEAAEELLDMLKSGKSDSIQTEDVSSKTDQTK